MNKIVSLIATAGISSTLLFGCSSQQSAAPKQIEKKVVAVQPSLTIANASVTKNDGNNLDVTVTAHNNTNKAIFIQSSDFALSNDSTTLSPTSQSNVPTQIPANSKTNLTLDFNVKGQLSGTINPKLGFQPSGNQPEQFQSLGSVKIPVPQQPVSKPVSKPVTTESKPTIVVAPSPHDYQTDVEQDIETLNAKVIRSYDGISWEPIIDPNPDAEAPDGFGGMLYAWNVILNGNGDGSAQQIYFFDNTHYLGRDTAQPHLDSSVHAGASNGTIIATYQHFLPNDPMSTPTGQPYIVSFHWNGSNLIPGSVATLTEAVNDQFK